jgi:hypothetical protein
MFCTECGSINPECGKFCHRCGELLFRPKADETSQFAEPSICKWQHALDEYRYPVNLTTFADRQEYSGWFTRNIEIGDRAQTIKFETLFRQNAPEHLEAWFEVVFWKPYKVAVPALSSYRAKIVIDSVRRRGVSAGELWSRCSEFTECPSIAKFEAFQELLSRAPSIALCATFPAFVAPEAFPMVDRQIAKWALTNYMGHGISSRARAGLEAPKQFISKDGRSDIWLTLSQYPFIESWTAWCRIGGEAID